MVAAAAGLGEEAGPANAFEEVVGAEAVELEEHFADDLYLPLAYRNHTKQGGRQTADRLPVYLNHTGHLCE